MLRIRYRYIINCADNYKIYVDGFTPNDKPAAMIWLRAQNRKCSDPSTRSVSAR